jgi:hypothetical protein
MLCATAAYLFVVGVHQVDDLGFVLRNARDSLLKQLTSSFQLLAALCDVVSTDNVDNVDNVDKSSMPTASMTRHSSV